MRSMKSALWRDRIALLRADFNVPMRDGSVADDSRLRASLPTIRHVLDGGGGVACLSHLGRPPPGGEAALSLEPVARSLSGLLGAPVRFCPEIPESKPVAGEVWMLENTRFHPGERENAPDLAARYARVGDVFVLDAFATAHRAEASVCALAGAAQEACAGLLLEREISALDAAMKNSARPLVAVVGGGKISTKVAALSGLLEICDALMPGGGVANALLAANGAPVGASLADPGMEDLASSLLERHREKIVLPEDVIVAREISESAASRSLAADDLRNIAPDEMIVDIGERSRRRCADLLRDAGTIVWNGPLGAFEFSPFAEGTRAVARAVADSSAYSLAGGGDTLAAIRQFGGGASYLSTGGGAFLEYLGGADLPALSALREAGGAA